MPFISNERRTNKTAHLRPHPRIRSYRVQHRRQPTTHSDRVANLPSRRTPSQGRAKTSGCCCARRREHITGQEGTRGSQTKTSTHLTSPPTPLHPSLPLVHPTRSFGFKFALDHVPPVAVPFPSPRPVAVPVVAVDVVDAASSSLPSSSSSLTNVATDLRRLLSAASCTHRSFSQRSTCASGARHTVSSSLSSSIRRRKKR